MDKVVKFPKEMTEECLCDLCQLADEYMQYIVMADNKEELREDLRDVVEQAFQLGYKKAIEDDLDNKLALLNHIESDFDEEE